MTYRIKLQAQTKLCLWIFWLWTQIFYTGYGICCNKYRHSTEKSVLIQHTKKQIEVKRATWNRDETTGSMQDWAWYDSKLVSNDPEEECKHTKKNSTSARMSRCMWKGRNRITLLSDGGKKKKGMKDQRIFSCLVRCACVICLVDLPVQHWVSYPIPKRL